MVLSKYPLQTIFFALSNPIRIKIYNLCLEKTLNITQISKDIHLSYKSTLHNLKVLEKAGLISKTEKITDKAKEILISSIPLRNKHSPGSVYEKIYDAIMEENKALEKRKRQIK